MFTVSLFLICHIASFFDPTQARTSQFLLRLEGAHSKIGPHTAFACQSFVVIVFRSLANIWYRYGTIYNLNYNWLRVCYLEGAAGLSNCREINLWRPGNAQDQERQHLGMKHKTWCRTLQLITSMHILELAHFSPSSRRFGQSPLTSLEQSLRTAMTQPFNASSDLWDEEATTSNTESNRSRFHCEEIAYGFHACKLPQCNHHQSQHVGRPIPTSAGT